jgi:hypothetical protein
MHTLFKSTHLPAGVEVHQLGKFHVKGAAAPVEIVQVTLAHLAARCYLLQQQPPKNPKGHCLQPLSGLVAAVNCVHLPAIAQLYKQQLQQRIAALQQQQQGDRLPGAAASGDLTLRQRSAVPRASGMFGSVAAASGRAFSWVGSSISMGSNSSSNAALAGLRLSMLQQQQQQQGVQLTQADVGVSLVPMNGASSSTTAVDSPMAQQQLLQEQQQAAAAAAGGAAVTEARLPAVSRIEVNALHAAAAAAAADSLV